MAEHLALIGQPIWCTYTGLTSAVSVVSPGCTDAGPGEQHLPMSLPHDSYLLSCLESTHSSHSCPLLLLLRSTDYLIAKPFSNDTLQIWDGGLCPCRQVCGQSCLVSSVRKNSLLIPPGSSENYSVSICCSTFIVGCQWLSTGFHLTELMFSVLNRCAIPCLSRRAVLLSKFSNANKYDWLFCKENIRSVSLLHFSAK